MQTSVRSFLLPSSIPASASQSWNPAGGASLSWQGRLTSLAVSYSHMISSGGGLIGAVQMDSASASIRQQFSRTFSGSVSGGYAQNDLSVPRRWPSSNNGHTLSGTASVQQQFGQHLNVQLGYTRLHQNYRRRRLASTPEHQSRICFGLLSILKTAGKIISMVDDLEEKSSEGFDLQHYLGVVRRRHLHFLIPLFLGWASCGERAGFCRRATSRAR